MSTTSKARPTTARWWIVAGAAGISIFAGSMVASTAAIASGSPQFFRVVPFSIALFSFIALGFSWWAAVMRSVDRRTRSAWTWIAASITLLCLSGVLQNLHARDDSFPRVADIPRLFLVPLMLVGLLRLPTHAAGGRMERAKLALDAGSVAVGAAIFLWYIQIGPAITAPDATFQRIAASTAFPLLDAVLIFGVAMVLNRGVNAANRRSMMLLVAATVPWITGDVWAAYGRSQARFGFENRPLWHLLLIITAHFLLAAAAFEQCRHGARHGVTIEHASVGRVSRLPYLAVASGFGLMLFAAAREHVLYPWGGLVLCATALTGLVATRQMLAQRENHRMAVTDGLTGLANRVSLHQRLSLALARGVRSDQATGVLLIDLNGFKQINDTLGHEAGDKLLVSFGEMLRRSILGSDLAGRLGGDEFAIVLHDIGTPENAEVVVRRILQEAAQPVLVGDIPMQVRGSIGIALSGPGELGVDDLVGHADIAMYQAKADSRRSGTSAWRHYQPSSTDGTAVDGTAETAGQPV
jgi:diguanylate cyclase (GGDEF)-like protein